MTWRNPSTMHDLLIWQCHCDKLKCIETKDKANYHFILSFYFVTKFWIAVTSFNCRVFNGQCPTVYLEKLILVFCCAPVIYFFVLSTSSCNWSLKINQTEEWHSIDIGFEFKRSPWHSQSNIEYCQRKKVKRGLRSLKFDVHNS